MLASISAALSVLFEGGARSHFRTAAGNGAYQSVCFYRDNLWCFHLRFTDVIDVVQAIKTHPDSEVGKCLKIGAVTCCVDPLNCFMQNRLV